MFATQTVCLIDIGSRSFTIACLFPRKEVAYEHRAMTSSQKDAFYVEVGQRVRSARERAGLTQDALALRVALSRTSVTNIERGRQRVLLHTLWDIASVLGVEPVALLPEMPKTSVLGASSR